jgi:hypothetical protein
MCPGFEGSGGVSLLHHTLLSRLLCPLYPREWRRIFFTAIRLGRGQELAQAGNESAEARRRKKARKEIKREMGSLHGICCGRLDRRGRDFAQARRVRCER